ncbi:MAG TPA: hypothetical protein H9695_06470 [Candidatus Mediterraneibacter excrementigallinarum]|nr:hypothetical protein [Candidatus Mediterraneibacter excrementigallinarum]
MKRSGIELSRRNADGIERAIAHSGMKRSGIELARRNAFCCTSEKARNMLS